MCVYKNIMITTGHYCELAEWIKIVDIKRAGRKSQIIKTEFIFFQE